MLKNIGRCFRAAFVPVTLYAFTNGRDEPKPKKEEETTVLQNDKKWPEGVVQYQISEWFTEQQEDEIKGAISEIEEKTCIRFKEGNQGSHVYIAYSNQCASRVGNVGDPNGQVLHLGPLCFTRGIILHEFMHALGFEHEHSRPDRDEYVHIHADNVEPDQLHNFEKLDSTIATLLKSKYAYDSIMHYKENFFAVDGSRPTLQPKRPFTGILGGGNQLSQVDIDRINAYYKCPVNCDNPHNKLKSTYADMWKVYSKCDR